MAVTGKVTLLNKYGLHQRPAMKVIETSTKFRSDIFLIHKEKRCNAKSIIDVIMLAAEMGIELDVEVSGADEQAALEAIQDLFAQNFYLGDEA